MGAQVWVIMLGELLLLGNPIWFFASYGKCNQTCHRLSLVSVLYHMFIHRELAGLPLSLLCYMYLEISSPQFLSLIWLT